MGVLREYIGEPRRGAEDQRDETDELGILPQQRKKAPARAQPGEETIEGGESRVRIFRARELIDDERHKLGQIGARLFAAQRPVEAGTPLPHGGRDLLRLAETRAAPAGPASRGRVVREKCQTLLPAQSSGVRSNSRT